jgi:hypothetical protein
MASRRRDTQVPSNRPRHLLRHRGPPWMTIQSASYSQRPMVEKTRFINRNASVGI